MDEKQLQFDDAERELAKEELKSCATSISEASTTVETYKDAKGDGRALRPGRSFFINARGIGIIRLPVPSGQLEIPIHHSDGSLAYTSTREKRCSNNSVLSSPKGGDLMTTSYFKGPNRNPIIRLLHSASESPQEIKISGKWTSRRQIFKVPDGSEFQWSYVRQEGRWGKSLMVLEKNEGSSSGPGRRLAQLVRNDETRPKGTRPCTAGNGGELVLDQDAHLELDEGLIVATCLVMLKKEIDRRRLMQFMMIAGMASGGS